MVKIKSGYSLKKVMGSYMIISDIENVTDTSSMQTLNETAAFIWSLLTEDTTVEKMTDAMLSEYEVDVETARNDIEAFVAVLDKNNLLDK